ncbi:hypothetical protein Ddc_10436 [Ditylenchus destructor]|nr:hypothetical protein Ddc_10436 [Ditylenchus destructor]
MSFTSTAIPGNFCSQTYEQYKYATRQLTVHRIALFALEYVIIVAGLGFGSLFCWALNKSTMIPKSCKILLYNLTASCFATTISRSIMIVNFLREESLIPSAIVPYLSNLHDISINVNIFNQITLAAQCLVTTAFKDFDRNSDFVTSYLFMYAIISFPWLCSGLTQYLDNIGVYPAMIRFSVFSACNFLSWMIFVILSLINREMYRRRIKGDVNGKFLIAIKIRTFHALSILAFITAIRNFITVGILLSNLFYFKPRCLFATTQLLSHFFDITVAIYVVIYPISFIVVHPELRRLFEKFLCRQSFASAPSNVIGERLIVHRSPLDHFAQLKSQWENAMP